MIGQSETQISNLKCLRIDSKLNHGLFGIKPFFRNFPRSLISKWYKALGADYGLIGDLEYYLCLSASTSQVLRIRILDILLINNLDSTYPSIFTTEALWICRHHPIVACSWIRIFYKFEGLSRLDVVQLITPDIIFSNGKCMWINLKFNHGFWRLVPSFRQLPWLFIDKWNKALGAGLSEICYMDSDFSLSALAKCAFRIWVFDSFLLFNCECISTTQFRARE